MRVLRMAPRAAVVLAMVLLPLDAGGMFLVLLLAAEFTVAAMRVRAVRALRAARVVTVADPATVALLRRVVPALRMRRPVAAIEQQVRWRAAGAARRERLRLVP